MNRGDWFSDRLPGGNDISLDILNLKQMLAVIVVLATVWFIVGAGWGDGAALFEKGHYREAQQVLSNALAETPEAPQLHFFLGRTHLALEEASAALPYLEKAVHLEPDNAAYHFWLGVNHWALLDLDRELAAYERTLEIDPKFWPAHVYAGHNQFDRGAWEPALGHYVTVLQVQPDHPEALYNAGVALHALGRQEEAVAVWRRYLEHHRSGDFAIDAVRNLNLEGDFSYRAFPIGGRFIAGPSPGFKKGTLIMDPQLIPTLDQIGNLMIAQPGSTLHIVAFVQNNGDLAMHRAKMAKRALVEKFPDMDHDQVRLSWFHQAETLQIDGISYNLDVSINIFTETTGGN